MRLLVSSSLTCLLATALLVFVAWHTGRTFDWLAVGAAAVFTVVTVSRTVARGLAARRGTER